MINIQSSPNAGNGFFDNEASVFNTTTTPNVYVLADTGNNSVKILEPIGYSVGKSSISTIALGGTTTIRDAVVGPDGMLYVGTSSGIYRRVNRGDTTPVYVNDSTKFTQITTGINIMRVRPGTGYIYYAESTNSRVGRISTTTLSDEVLYTLSSTPKSVDVDAAGNTYAASYTTGAFVGCGNKNQLLLYVSKNGVVIKTLLDDGINGGLDFDLNIIGGKIYYAYVVPDGGTTGSGCGAKRGSGIMNQSGGTIGSWGYPSYTTGAGTPIFSGGPYDKIVLTKNELSIQTVSVNDTTTIITSTPAQLAYSQATLTSIYSTYYQNQNWQLQANIRVTSAVFAPVAGNYMYYIDVIDNASGYVASTEKFSLLYPFFPDSTAVGAFGCVLLSNCDYGRSYPAVFRPSAGQVFKNTTYKARLWEYNISTGATGFLADAGFNVLAGNATQVGQIQGAPGDIAQPLSIIDGWTAMFGLGVNSASKFLFAIFWIVCITFLGFMLSGKNAMGGAVSGFMPFAFFTYIAYVPFWFMIVAIILIGLKIGWFR